MIKNIGSVYKSLTLTFMRFNSYPFEKLDFFFVEDAIFIQAAPVLTRTLSLCSLQSDELHVHFNQDIN
jgi:hypothetical protein